MAVRSWPAAFEMPHVDRRMILSALLAGLAAVFVLLITRPPDRVPVLVADSNLAAGTALGELNVGVRYVETADGLVAGSSVGELSEWTLTTPIGEGEPLLASLLKPPAMTDTPNLVALSLGVEHAVLGALQSGDRVDVYVTTSDGFGAVGVTERVASEVFVSKAVISDDPSRRGSVDLLLAVDDSLAVLITSAGRAGGVDLVKVAP